MRGHEPRVRQGAVGAGRAGNTMSPDDAENPPSGRNIYGGREPQDRLFRGRERSGSASAEAGKPRRRPGRSWSIIFLAVVALYGLAATAYIVVRTPSLPGLLKRWSAPRPDSGGAEVRREVPAPVAPGPAAAGERSAAVVGRLRAEARSSQDAVLDADRMVARGLPRDALVRLERRAAEGDASLELRLSMARIRFALGEAEAARDGFLAVLGADPSNTGALAGLAAVLLKLGDPDGALQAAQWAMDEGGSGVDVLRVAAHAAIGVGQYTVAAAHARVWLQQDPEAVEAQDLLGLCHLRLGEYGKASFLLGELIRQGRGSEASYLNLVLAFGQQKQFNDVADLLMKAVQRLDRRSVLAWFGRPDFKVLREDPVVAAVAGQIIEGASPGLTLRLPEVAREIPMERGIGMTPSVDLGIRKPSAQ